MNNTLKKIPGMEIFPIVIMENPDVHAAMKLRAVNRDLCNLTTEMGLIGSKDAELTGNLHDLQTRESRYHTLFMGCDFELSKEITVTKRKKLVDWLILAAFKMYERPAARKGRPRLDKSCLNLAVQLVDWYVTHTVVPLSKYQLVGTVAMKIASEGVHGMRYSLKSLSYITNYSSTEEDIVEMEIKMLQALTTTLETPTLARPAWLCIEVPTSYDFLYLFLQVANADMQAKRDSAMYWLDIYLINESTMIHSPSFVAAGVTMLALRSELDRNDWNLTLEYYTSYKQKEVAPLADKMQKIIREHTGSDTPELEKKYNLLKPQ